MATFFCPSDPVSEWAMLPMHFLRLHGSRRFPSASGLKLYRCSPWHYPAGTMSDAREFLSAVGLAGGSCSASCCSGGSDRCWKKYGPPMPLTETAHHAFTWAGSCTCDTTACGFSVAVFACSPDHQVKTSLDRHRKKKLVTRHRFILSIGHFVTSSA